MPHPTAARFAMDPRHARKGNRVELLRDGTEAFPRMLRAIAAARVSILVEMYIFASDPTGKRFMEALAERARAGVPVRVIYDAIGSMGSDFSELEAAGVQLLQYHPVTRLWFRKRDHRKLIVVDGRVAYVGGLNLAREWDTPEAGGGGWRDTAVEIEGPAADDLSELFRNTWAKETGSQALPEPSSVPAPLPDGIRITVLGSEKFRARRPIARGFLQTIRAARKRIWITNAYFVPAPRFMRALRRAARRGVDVRILVPAKPDVRAVYYASRANFSPLLSRGARIFEWQGNVMHAKTAVIDGVWCTVGSFNLDHQSIFHNLELTVIAMNRRFAGKMEAMFEEDLRQSTEVSYAEWKKRSWWKRLVEALFYLLSPLL